MKGKKTDFGSAPCAVARSLQVIGDWWSLLIVRDALLGAQRFGEFQKSTGIARNILSTRLKKLVEEGVLRIEPRSAATRIPKYQLTAKGEQLSVVIAALWQWGAEHCFARGERAFDLVESAGRQKFAALELHTTDGRALRSRGLRLSLTGVRAARQSKAGRASA